MRNSTPINNPVTDPYSLVSYPNGSSKSECNEYSSMEDLAIAAYRASWDYRRYPDIPAIILKALTPTGDELNVIELATWGRRILRSRFPLKGYTRRRGPVPGIGKWRGGQNFRRIHTTAERRQAVLIVCEDGEVAPRASRNCHALQNFWDDTMRTRDRSWKSQSKGAKAWIR